MRHRTVRDVMTADVVTVGAATPAKDVAEALDRRRISGVPVTDDAGRVLGVVTGTDLLHKITYQDDGEDWPRFLRRHRVDREKAHGTTARELMTAPAVTIGPEATIVEAANALERRGVKRLPVVDAAGSLVGIVSRADLVKVFTRPDEEIGEEIRTDVVERALLLPPVAITVEVTDGRVTLRGSVERRSEAVLAAALARRVDGVVHLADHIGYLSDDVHYVYQ